MKTEAAVLIYTEIIRNELRLRSAEYISDSIAEDFAKDAIRLAACFERVAANPIEPLAI